MLRQLRIASRKASRQPSAPMRSRSYSTEPSSIRGSARGRNSMSAAEAALQRHPSARHERQSQRAAASAHDRQLRQPHVRRVGDPGQRNQWAWWWCQAPGRLRRFQPLLHQWQEVSRCQVFSEVSQGVVFQHHGATSFSMQRMYLSKMQTANSRY